MRFFLLLAVIPLLASAGTEGMPGMPRIEPKKTYSVPSAGAGEALQEQRGFGDKEPEVRMMNLMMVGGSGMEGMEMGAMKTAPETHGKAKAGPRRYSIRSEATALRKGAQLFDFSVVDSNTGGPAVGLKLKAELSMTSMDMGTETPPVAEVAPGKYRVKLVFAMSGPWALKLAFPDGEESTIELAVGKP